MQLRASVHPQDFPEASMNLKDRLRHVFKETFLDMFQDEPPAPETIEDALSNARKGAEEATDALAAFTVTDLHLKEEYQRILGKVEFTNKQLEAALSSNDDDQARALIRERQPLEKEAATLKVRVDESQRQQEKLKERVAAMKAQVLEIEQKKLELQLRDRAAEAIDQVNLTEAEIEEAHGFATGTDAEAETLRREALNEISADERNTLESRLDTMLEDDAVEQELARLKQQRNQ